jgi:hypothetical protein
MNYRQALYHVNHSTSPGHKNLRFKIEILKLIAEAIGFERPHRESI